MAFFSCPTLRSVKKAINTPVVSPATGDMFIVLGSPTGAFSSFPNTVSMWNGSSYDFIAPNVNVLLFTEDSNTLYQFDTNTSAWVVPAASSAGSGTINSGTSGNLALYTGSTTLDDLAIGSTNQILGINNAGNAHEYKSLVQGSNVTITHGANSVTIAASTGSSPPFTDTLSIIEGSVDPSKQLRFEVDGLTASNIRVWTVPDFDLTVTGTASTQTLTNKTINASNNTLSNITEAMLSFSDVTTLNATTSQHGFLRKLDNNASSYMDGTGNWSTPSGTGTSLPASDTQTIVKGSTDVSKLLRFEIDGFTSGFTRVLTPPDSDGVLVLESFAQTLTNKTLTTPTIGSFANATHDHSNAAGGGNLTPTAIGLSDPNADRVLFWDDSAGVFAWLTMGTNLTITGTTLDASSGGGGSWSGLTNPSGNLSLAMAANTTTFTWAGNFSSGNAFDIVGSDTSATGNLVRIRSGISTVMSPLSVESRTGQALRVDNLQNVLLGKSAPLNSDTSGFPYIPVLQSSTEPSATPTSHSGFAPLVMENDAIFGEIRLWTYLQSGWKLLTPVGGRYTTQSGSGTVNVDWSTSKESIAVRSVSITGNTTFTFTAPTVSGTICVLIIIEDASGGDTVTFPSSVKFDGASTFVPSQSANAKSSLTMIYDGTNYLEISRSSGIA